MYDVNETQAVLSWLPGYIWSKGVLKSAGGALKPTMHMRADGELMVYVRPIFEEGPQVGMFLKLSGIKAAISRGEF